MPHMRLGGRGKRGLLASVAAVAAVLVLYPIYFLVQASLDVGDPDVRPPAAYGFDNYAALPRYWEIMLNTLGEEVVYEVPQMFRDKVDFDTYSIPATPPGKPQYRVPPFEGSVCT